MQVFFFIGPEDFVSGLVDKLMKAFIAPDINLMSHKTVVPNRGYPYHSLVVRDSRPVGTWS